MESNQVGAVPWLPALSPPGGGNKRVIHASTVGQLAWSLENHVFENQNLESVLCYLHSRFGRPSIFPNFTNSEVALA